MPQKSNQQSRNAYMEIVSTDERRSALRPNRNPAPTAAISRIPRRGQAVWQPETDTARRTPESGGSARSPGSLAASAASSVRLIRNRIDDRIRDMLAEDIATQVAGTRLDSDTDTAILAGMGLRALRRHLPGAIQHTLQEFAESGEHALLLENLPTQAFPDTPASGFADEPGLALINALHFGLMQVLRLTPFAVPYENDGRLIRNVAPNPAAAGTTSSWGADSEFFWHTDNPHLPFNLRCGDPRVSPPRYLTFYAVRNLEQVPTEITALDDVLSRLKPSARRWLRAPVFEVGPPASVRGDAASTESPLIKTAVLEPSATGERVRFDEGTTVGLTQAARTALRAWRESLTNAPARALVMSPGEFLIFDNHRLLHRRKAFTPVAQGSARWLRRCYVG
jgi:L-asparagine oxygenase